MLIMLSKFHKINIFCSLSSRFSPSGTSLRHRRKKLHPSSLSSDWVPYTTGLLEKVSGPVTPGEDEVQQQCITNSTCPQRRLWLLLLFRIKPARSVEKKTLLVVVSPLRFTVTPPAKVVAWVGDTFMLNCSATGDPQRVISWKKQGCELPVGRSQQFNG